MKTFLCELLFSCLLAAPGAKSVDELTYGTALFAYYQQDYQQALLEVMVAEGQQRTGDDPVRFELARGSFAFQEDMHRLAAATFDGVAAEELTDLDRMRLAFHMARQHYRHGAWSAMEGELARIDLGANWRGRPKRHPEAAFMRAEGALARGDFAAARGVLETLPAQDAYLAYGLFNLGVAEREAGDPMASRASFERLATLTPKDPEAWDLVQRGRLALAVMARDEGAAVDARALLGRLPGEGRYRDQALASYGNLAMAAGDDELAARIWLTLLERDGWSSSRALAQLALPMSLERLASPARALDQYRQAEQVFAARLDALAGAADQARDPVWVGALLNVFAEPDDAQRAQALAGFDDRLGEETWLAWLATEDVHRLMVEWRELGAMADWLQDLPGRIGAYQQVTAERRRRAAAAGTMLGAESLQDRRASLAGQVEQQAAQLTALRAAPSRMDTQWMLALADDTERELVADLAAMAELSGKLPARDQPRYQARIRRLQGLTFWQIADQRSARIHALDKQLTANRQLLADVDLRITQLAEAEGRFAAGVETDFVLLQDRADVVAGRVAAAIAARRRVIADALERGLQREMAQTRRYLLTARIAIARATDQLASAPVTAESGS